MSAVCVGAGLSVMRVPTPTSVFQGSAIGIQSGLLTRNKDIYELSLEADFLFGDVSPE